MFAGHVLRHGTRAPEGHCHRYGVARGWRRCLAAGEAIPHLLHRPDHGALRRRSRRARTQAGRPSAASISWQCPWMKSGRAGSVSDRRTPVAHASGSPLFAVSLHQLFNLTAVVEQVDRPATVVGESGRRVNAEYVIERGQHVLRRVRFDPGPSPRRSVAPTTWPVCRPPPASRAKPDCGQWSRPAVVPRCVPTRGVRPISPQTTTATSRLRPRSCRSVTRAWIDRSYCGSTARRQVKI